LIELESARQTGLEFGELVRRHQSMVFSICWHFLHDREQAEDVAQEVFLGLHRNLESIHSAAHAGHWLRKVAVQRSIDAGRQRRRRPQMALEDVPEPAAETAVRDPMLGARLRRLIATLPETPRVVMVLRYQEDLDPAEIGQMLEMPVATVKSHLQRSLARLREKLARRA
jgi:RNA polymerase sigma-70 factor (ECF subfamily)